MKRKRLALFLAIVLTVTSTNGTVMAVSAEDFTVDSAAESETESVDPEFEEPEITEENPEVLTEETSEDTADIEFSDGDTVETEEEVSESPEIVEDSETEEPELTSEEKEVESIQATLNNDKVAAGVERFLSVDVAYTFNDGTVETAKLRTGKWISGDSLLGVREPSTSIINVEDPEEYEYQEWQALPSGTYKATFSLDGVTSNELEFQTVDIEDVVAIEGVLQEGDNPGTKTPEYEAAYYKFVPSVTDFYSFKNYKHINKYVKNETGELNRFSGEMTAGTTYYIQLWGSVWNEDTWEDEELCNLNIYRERRITGISFEPVRTEIYDRNALRNDDGRIFGNLVITYNDGSVWREENLDCTTGYTDNDSNNICIIVEDENGDTFWADDLSAGIYTVYLECGDVVSDSFTLTVKEFNADKFPQLAVGTNKVSIGTWYTFKPDATEIYGMNFNSSNFKQKWYYLNEDGEAEQLWLDDDNQKILSAGMTYLIYFSNDAGSQKEYDYVIDRATTPEKLTVISEIPSPVVFIKELKNVNFSSSLSAEVTFTDGSKRIVFVNEEDSYKRYLSWNLMKKDEDGNYNEIEAGIWDEVPAGDYIVRVSYGRSWEETGRIYAEDIPVKVISLADAEKTELKTGTQSIQNKNGANYQKFCPEETGRYEFSFNIPVRLTGVDEKGKFISDYWYENLTPQYTFYANLTKDVVYYIQAQADEECEELKVTTSLLQKPERMKIKTGRTTYIAGVDNFDNDEIETEVIYPDKTSRKIKNNEKLNGQSISYVAEKDDSVAYNGDSLCSGVWKIKTYLGGSLLKEIPIENAEITVEKPELSQYPIVEEDAEITVKTDDRMIYAFKAKQAGKYIFDTENAGSILFYRDGEFALVCEDESINLRKGETCAVVVNVPEKAQKVTFQIKKQEIPSTEAVFELSEGMKKFVAIDEPYKEIEAVFTPEETGYYKFTLETEGNESVIPQISLYDADNKLMKKAETYLQYELEKDKTYHYKVKLYEDQTGALYFNFDRFYTKEIQNIEIQTKEGKNIDDFSILDSFSEYFELKVTYTDGEIQIFEWNTDADTYGNIFSIMMDNANIAELTDNEITCRMIISDRNTLAGGWYKDRSKVTLKRKGFAAIDQLKAGETQDLLTDSENHAYKKFMFQAPEDGEYMVRLDGNIEESAGIKVYSYSLTNRGVLELKPLSQNYETEGVYSCQLERNRWYIIEADAVAEKQKLSINISKAKNISKLELIKAPARTSVSPENANSISLEGMEVKATYTDGSVETITYGKKDSSGRYLQYSGIKWINGETACVYVSFGKYRVAFEAKAGASDECIWKETVRKDATCTEDGSVTETCSVHGETRTEVLPKLGHDLGARQTTKAATCGAAGESARICKRCKGKFEKQTINATGKHKFSSWKTVKGATVLAEGQKERTCSVCKKKEAQKIAKLKATLTLSVAAKKTLPLKLNRSYKVNVQMAKGDSVSYWKSSNTKAVTVDKYGKITGKQAGKTAKITVKLRSGLITWFNVKVQKTDVATTSLKLKNASIGKYMAGSVTLKAKQKLKVTPVIAPVTGTQKVTYTTSNKKVAAVASDGQITANARGTAYITAKSGRKSVRIKVTVK